MTSAIRATATNRRVLSQLPKSWREIATGERDMSELTDEEVFKGRLLRADGVLGARPSFYPQNFIDEQVRRSLNWANDEIRAGAREAIQVFRDVMNDTEAEYKDRLKAAQFFTDRFLGKEVQRVLVSAEDPVETLFRQILADPQGLAGAPPPHELSAEERELLS